MNVRRFASAFAVLVGITGALSGCGQSPLAPDGSASGGVPGGTYQSPPIVAIAPDGSVSYVPAPVGTVSGGSALSGTLLGSLAVTSSTVIDGSKGGTVRAGRFSVKLPAGAFVGTATVTATMADSTVMIGDLSISPQSANKFKYPAQLTVDLSGLNLTDLSPFTMYWYDPSTKLWVNISRQTTISGTNVTASLSHFSTYAAGKAGW